MARTTISTRDIPEALRLPDVRRLVEALHDGITEAEELMKRAGLTKRHVAYYRDAARTLGWIQENDGRFEVTHPARQLLKTSPGSAQERSQIQSALNGSPVMVLLPDLLERQYEKDELVKLLVARVSGFSESTAKKRAGALLRWREYVLGSAQNPAPKQKLARSKNSRVEETRELGERPVHVEQEFNPNHLKHLSDQVRYGKIILLTGAGFSAEARSIEGKPLPVGGALAKEIWEISFPNEDFDASASLPDIYQHALNRKPKPLLELLRRRLRVDANTLPDFYRTWFRVPWRRIYTLNVDDLAQAAEAAFQLPRRINPIYAAAESTPQADRLARPGLPVIHLNGGIDSPQSAMTFSTTHYAERLGRQDSWYAQLANDLRLYCVVFVGTPMNEELFWMHLQLRGKRGSGHEVRPRSYLISPQLNPARRELLKEHNIAWVQMTAEQFATSVLSPLEDSVREGLGNIDRELGADQDSVDNIRDVAFLATKPPGPRTEFLLGAEPTWADLVSGRAIERECDDQAASSIETILMGTQAEGTLRPTLVFSGTAGSGKSTSLMRAALRLSGNGQQVFWLGAEANTSADIIERFVQDQSSNHVLAIDSAERYGARLPGLIRAIAQSGHTRLLLISLRASRLSILQDNRLEELQIERFGMPQLQDRDIDGLLDALDADNRLGVLKGKSRDEQKAVFRERANRQLLVAMIEATSGRRFDDKVADEWIQLDEPQRHFYGTVAIVSSLGHYHLTRDELALTGDGNGSANVEAIRHLCDAKILVSGTDGALRARHRVIAEQLVKYLQRHGYLARIYPRLAIAMSFHCHQEAKQRNSRQWRLMKALINHERLMRLMDEDDARVVYEKIEQPMSWDHQYWLQRGAFELEYDLTLAENFLGQALGLAPDDALVQTTHAHMQLRKAIAFSKASGAAEMVEQAVATLTVQTQLRGKHDPYPYHVLGTQALRWSPTAPWSVERRRNFLREVRAVVEQGASIHRRTSKYDLQRLARDLEHAIHAQIFSGAR